MATFTHIPEGHVRKSVDEWPSVQGSAPRGILHGKMPSSVSSWNFTYEI